MQKDLDIFYKKQYNYMSSLQKTTIIESIDISFKGVYNNKRKQKKSYFLYFLCFCLFFLVEYFSLF